eukprot:1224250-Karenia_brevis.AAC.1
MQLTAQSHQGPAKNESGAASSQDHHKGDAEEASLLKKFEQVVDKAISKNSSVVTNPDHGLPSPAVSDTPGAGSENKDVVTAANFEKMLEKSKAFANMKSNVQDVKSHMSSLENSQSKSFERLEALILQTRAPNAMPGRRSRAVPGPRADAGLDDLGI